MRIRGRNQIEIGAEILFRLMFVLLAAMVLESISTFPRHFLLVSYQGSLIYFYLVWMLAEMLLSFVLAEIIIWQLSRFHE